MEAHEDYSVKEPEWNRNEDDVRLEIQGLVKDCEQLLKKTLMLRNEQNIGNAEFSFVSSSLTATQHYHNNLHVVSQNFAQYVKERLLQLEGLLTSSSDTKDNKDDLLGYSGMELTYSTLRNNESISEMVSFSNTSRINQTYPEDFTISERVEKEFLITELKNKISEIEIKLKDKCGENEELKSKLLVSEKTDEFNLRHNNPMCLAAIEQSLLVNSDETFLNPELGISSCMLDFSAISTNTNFDSKSNNSEQESTHDTSTPRCCSPRSTDYEVRIQNLQLENKMQSQKICELELQLSNFDELKRNDVVKENNLHLINQENEELKLKLNNLNESHDKLLKEVDSLNSESFMQLSFTRPDADSSLNDIKNRIVEMEKNMQVKHQENEDLLSKFNKLILDNERLKNELSAGKNISKHNHQNLINKIKTLSDFLSQPTTNIILNVEKLDVTNDDEGYFNDVNMKINKIIDENRLLNQKNIELSEKLCELNESNEEFELNYNAKCEENEELSNKLSGFDELEQKYDHLERKYAEFELKADVLEHDLKVNVQQLEKYQNMSLELKSFYNDTFCKSTSSKIWNEDEFDLKFLKTKVNETIQEVSDKKEQFEKLQKKLAVFDELQIEHKKLQAEFDGLSTELMENVELAEEYKSKCEKLLQAQNKVTSSTISQTDLTIETLEEDKNNYDDLIKKLNTEITEKNSEISKLNLNITDYKNQISAMQIRLNNTKKENNDLSQQIDAHIKSLEKVTKQCSEQKRNINELESMNCDNNEIIMNLRKQHTDLTEENDKLEKNLISVEKESRKFKIETIKLNTNISNLQNEISDLNKTLKTSEELVESLKSKSVVHASNHQEEHLRIVESLNQTMAKLAEAQDKYLTLEKEMHSLQLENSKYAKDNETAMKNVAELKIINEQLKETTSKYDQLEKELKTEKQMNEKMKADSESKAISESKAEKDSHDRFKKRTQKDLKELTKALKNVNEDTTNLEECKNEILRIKDKDHGMDSDLKKPLIERILAIIQQLDESIKRKLENSALAEELSKLKADYNEKLAENVKLLSINSTLEIRNEDLQTELNLICKNSPRARKDLHSMRRSLHDSLRKISPSPIPIDAMEVDNFELQDKFDQLEVQYNALLRDNVELKKHMEKQIAETASLIKVNRQLKATIKMLQKKKATCESSTNTEADDTPALMSLFVDKMTHNAEKEKNKKLENQISDLRVKNRELSEQIRRLNLALQNNTMQNLLPSHKSNNDEHLQSKILELESCLVKKDKQIKELEERCKELDDECEKCQTVMEENRTSCNSMYDQLQDMEANFKKIQRKYEEQKKDLEKYKDRCTVDDSAKKKLLQEISRVPLSPKTNNESNRENMELENSLKENRAIQQLKFDESKESLNVSLQSADLATLKKQFTILQMQNVSLQQKLLAQNNMANIQMSHGIVQQQRFGEYFTANQTLFSENLKLRKLCHKYMNQVKDLQKNSS